MTAAELMQRANAICREKPSFDDSLRLAELKCESYNRTSGKLEGYNCPICLNRGQLMRVTEDGHLVIRECKCMNARRSMAGLKRSGMEPLARRCRFDNFQTQEPWQLEARQRAQAFARDPTGRWFMACGTAGSGKTHLCSAICREMMLRCMGTKYMLWTQDSKLLKACVNDSEEYSRRIEPLKTVRVLYIDDFLKVKAGDRPTSGDVNLAFEIINARYIDHRLITVISSEWYPDDLLEIDAALGSRIYERAKGAIISIAGADKNWRLRERS